MGLGGYARAMPDETPPPLPPGSDVGIPPNDGPIPVVEPPPVASEPPPIRGTVEQDKPCFRCSYNLRGLPVSGVCPECGAPVMDSLRGLLLRFAAPEYIGDLRRGLVFVLVAAIITVVMMVVSLVAAILVTVGTSGSTGSMHIAQVILNFVGLGPALLAVYGYWLYTRPDPAYVGTEMPDTARKILRAAIVIGAVCALTKPVGYLLAGPGGMNFTTSNPAVMAGAIGVALSALVGGVAWIAQFFAAMSYSKWIALRLPDAAIEKQAKLYMWLLPTVFVVGYLCVGLGPLAAMIMYLLFLNTLRVRIEGLRDVAVAEQLAREYWAQNPPPPPTPP